MASNASISEAGPEARDTPNNLPVLRSSIVGRKAELAAARDLLLREDLGLLTFTGPGGVGKTRLALQLASQLLERFPRGVFFVNLAPISEPSLVVSTIAQTLGIKESPSQPLIESLKGYLRAKQILLVLDNFEQVVEAAPTVAELLASSPRLKVLTTSREVLHLYEEYSFPVLPLDFPEPKQLLGLKSNSSPLEQVTQYEAVVLFIQRALAVKPDFEVTNANAPAIAEICYRLDGLPLAIELAATRVRFLTPQAILSRLEQRLPLLIGGARDLPVRHQTLRNTIAWSYDLLDDAEQKLFRRLAVFVGGRTLEAIEAVCNAEGALEIDGLEGVSSLVDKSLLREEVGVGAEPRIVMLETIHEYAREKLQQSGEAEEIHKRHALYFMALAEESEPALRGAHQVVLLDRLEQEHDNLRAAIEWSRIGAGEAGRLEIGLRIGGALLKFWDTRGHFTEGREQLALLMSRAESFPPTASRAKALITAGRLAWQQGDLAAAVALYEESLTIYRPLGDKLGMTYALNGLSNTAKMQGDYAKAASFLEQNLIVAQELGDKQRVGAVYCNLGEIAVAVGDYDRGRKLLEEGLAISRELDEIQGLAVKLLALGILELSLGDYNQAKRAFEESLALCQEVGEKRFTVAVLYELGQVARAQGDYAHATELFTESLPAAHSLGDMIFVGLNFGGLAAVASIEARPERAARLFGASDAMLHAVGYHLYAVDRGAFDQGKAAAYAHLGEEHWHSAWEVGRAWSLEEAVAYALEPMTEAIEALPTETAPDHTTGDVRTSSGAEPYPQQLSKREVEVLRLVAEGLTAPQVAERLYLSVRTVENHLRSIYGKLNVSTRAAATRIAVERGLLND